MSDFKFTPTSEQLKELNAVINELKGTPGALMPILQRAQDIFGYLPQQVQQIISEFCDIPLEEIYGVVTFYSQFRTVPQGKNAIGICLGTACYVKGSGELMEAFERELNLDGAGTTPDGLFSLVATRCIGCCGLAPVLTVNDEVYGKVTPADVPRIIAKYKV